MSVELEGQPSDVSSAPRTTSKQPGAISGGIQYAKAPSMLWFILPMAALLAYGFLSR